jgi:hypothetical protein
MKFETEIVQDKQKALIVSKKNYDFIVLLKDHLKKFSVDPYFSSVSSKLTSSFDYFFFIEEEYPIHIIKESVHKKFVFIYSKNNRFIKSLIKHHLPNVKMIETKSENLKESDIDKILWFCLTQTREKHLKITNLFSKEKSHVNKTKIDLNKYLTRKNFTLTIIYFIVSIHFIFIPLIILSSIFSLKGYLNMKNNKFFKAKSDAYISNSLNLTGNQFYQIVRPTYLLFGIAQLPDDLIEINKNSVNTLLEMESILDNAKSIQKLIFTKGKTTNEIDDLKLRFSKLNKSLGEIHDSIIIINQKLGLPFNLVKKMKTNLLEISDLLDKTRKLLVYSESIFTQKTPNKYLIFFANNMELRPGGGFIGSFAIVTISNYEVQEIKVNDVYDADGQLTAHIDPPKPIEKYLNMPHWFLRDSNFAPDFVENYNKGLFFIEKELGISDFSGGILLTTTAVENILTAFDSLYLPDFKETINTKNFYLKTQFYTEKNFFPGSIQKRVFLSSVIQQLLLKLEGVSSEKFLVALKKSLDEKQMVVFLEDSAAQTTFDTSFWSGRVIEPKCLSGGKCISDFLFPYDANVGANKANFFINRYFHLKTSIDSQGRINHLLSIQYQNNSPAEIFPTGTYRNYFQVLIPRNSLVKKITIDGVLVENYDQKDDIFKLIGFFFEVAPKKKVEIKISYQLGEALESYSQVYQLVFQKQIGANNSDLILDFDVAKNISLVNHNFSPLVKDRQILYNTNLSTDKIFFIELKKE